MHYHDTTVLRDLAKRLLLLDNMDFFSFFSNNNKKYKKSNKKSLDKQIIK